MSSPASEKVVKTRAVRRRPFLEVLLVFLRLGVTSFGGPVAHLGYFRAEFVERRKWLDEAAYVDIVALCQFLPGPASSQVHHARHTACRFAGDSSRLVWVHDSFGGRHDRFPGTEWASSATSHMCPGYTRAGVQVALRGVNAAVVGLLLAALYTPVWTSAIFRPTDFGLGVVAFLLLVMWRVPPWLAVILGAVGATIIANISWLAVPAETRG
jgi:chromate transporter